MSFKTQMTAGYNYPNTEDKISDLLAPEYLLFSLGMDYKPTPGFSLFLSSLTSKNTIVNDDDILIKVGGSEGDPIMGKRVQFKEVIGVGLTDKFVN